MIDSRGRPSRGRLPLTEIAVWVIVTCGALSVNTAHPFFTAKLAVGLAVTAVAGAVSRRFPEIAQAIGIGLSQYDGHYYAVVALVAFLSGLRTGSLRSLAWAPVSAVPAIFVAGLVVDPRPVGGPAAELVASVVVPWLLGRNLRQRRELAGAGWDRARHLEREQEMLAEHARSRERARIAQDMHDSLGHDLALLALRAAALEVDPALDDTRRTRAAELRAGAAAATDRLHEIIGVLRTDADPGPTDPVHEALDELVARSRASGLAVELERAGEPAEPSSPAVSLAVHRVVREALTNAAKHAPGAHVTVSVVHTGASTDVRVVNARPPAPAAAAGDAECAMGGRSDARTAVPEAGLMPGRLSAGTSRAVPVTGDLMPERVSAGAPGTAPATGDLMPGRVSAGASRAMPVTGDLMPGRAPAGAPGTMPATGDLIVSAGTPGTTPPTGDHAAPKAAPGSRSGLISLRERVRLAGGSLRAGPLAGGFEVAARFAHPPARSEEGRTA